MTSVGAQYIGRFAPSPTGPLHAGSLVAALASWLDARAHNGQWLVRMEDVDRPRCVAGMDRTILQQLSECGLYPDAPPLWQSQRSALYLQALDSLVARHLAYPCACTRRDIETALRRQSRSRSRHGELVYPGTCRGGLAKGLAARKPSEANRPAWRFRTDLAAAQMLAVPVDQIKAVHPSTEHRFVHWDDRRLGPQQQDVEAEVGDFVLKRADGCFSYQLAVVVDDAAQGITDVVRGEDLADNTARQILLQRSLGLPTPRYRHTPLVLGARGEKLSKQNGARAIDTTDPLAALNAAAALLGLPGQPRSNSDALSAWVKAWAMLACARLQD